MKIKEIEDIISKYGDIKLSDLISKIKGDNVFKCPNCEAKGFILEEYDAYPRNLPDSGWATDIRKREKTCNICNGLGYVNKELKPITKIIGYQ